MRASLLLIICFSLAFLNDCASEPEGESDFEIFNQELREIRQFLDENNIQNVDSSDSGLFFVIHDVGDNEPVKPNGFISVHMNAKRLRGGDEFLNSRRDLDAPLSFLFGTDPILAALEEGMTLIGEGGSITLYSPSILAWGRNGFDNLVAPNEPIIFFMEVIEVDNVPQRKPTPTPHVILR